MNIDTLLADCDHWQEVRREDDTQVVRRAYVKAAFAAIEGMIDWLRHQAIDSACSGDGGLNITRLQLLQLEEFQIEKNGTLKLTDQRHRFLNYAAFVLRALAEENGIDFSPHLSSHGWGQLQSSYRLRNRLTHPKTDTNLDVSDAELTDTSEGVRWFFNAMFSIFGEILDLPDDLSV